MRTVRFDRAFAPRVSALGHPNSLRNDCRPKIGGDHPIWRSGPCTSSQNDRKLAQSNCFRSSNKFWWSFTQHKGKSGKTQLPRRSDQSWPSGVQLPFLDSESSNGVTCHADPIIGAGVRRSTPSRKGSGTDGQYAMTRPDPSPKSQS